MGLITSILFFARTHAIGFFMIALVFAPLFQTAAQSPNRLLDPEKRYLLLPESLFNEGKYEYALPLYLDFMEIYPDSRYRARTLETIALIYEREQRYPEALETYRLLYQDAGVSNKGLGYLYNQARILSLMGERERAEKIYFEIIRISPDSPYAHKARINSRLGRIFDEGENPESEETP